MKTVYPTAFSFRQEKNIPGLYDNNQRNKYHLTLECTFNEEEEDEIINSKKKNGSINPTTLIRRRKKFNQNLTELVKRHHKAFLASLNPPLTIPDEKVLRWHPAFALDAVPEVEVAPLPLPPIKETYTTAKDVLNVAQGRLAQHVQDALASVGGGEASEPVVTDSKQEKEKVNTNPELKGVSAALLEKVCVIPYYKITVYTGYW